MKKHLIRSLILILSCFVLFSAVKLVQTIWESKKTRELLPLAVARIEEMLPAKTAGVLEERSNMSMATLPVNGENFVGLLEVASYNVKLPVFAVWSQSTAKRPAVYMGNPYDGSLIIGVDLRTQFHFADTVETGTELCFTDLYGQVFTYRLDSVKHADSTQSLASEADDLTVFTKTDSGYLILRCVLCYNGYHE